MIRSPVIKPWPIHAVAIWLTARPPRHHAAIRVRHRLVRSPISTPRSAIGTHVETWQATVAKDVIPYRNWPKAIAMVLISAAAGRYPITRPKT